MPATPVRVIGVLDVMGGRAVHARRGDRARYAPVQSGLLPNGAEPGDAAALARAYAAAAGLVDLYVADLDAIAGARPQRALVRDLSAAFLAAGGRRVLLDAGIAAPPPALDALADGATHVVVGLETLASFDALREVADAVGAGRALFSLDLRDGTPLLRAGAAHARLAASPLALAEAAVAAGASGVIVIDLARVGGGGGGGPGVDLALVRALRRALPRTELLAGGGVRDATDLARLADAGCDGALVATALHEGRM